MKKQCKRKKYFLAPSIVFIRGQKETGDDRAAVFWIKTEMAWAEIRLGQDVYGKNEFFKHVATTIKAAVFCMSDPLLAKNRNLDGMREIIKNASFAFADSVDRTNDRYDNNPSIKVRYSFTAAEHNSICRFFDQFGAVHAAIPFDAWEISWNLAANHFGFKELLTLNHLKNKAL
jgi:hypothetical protein